MLAIKHYNFGPGKIIKEYSREIMKVILDSESKQRISKVQEEIIKASLDGFSFK